ncbi:hypothetical protein AUP68_11077 [Ilyonectria robusta]
MDVSTGKVLFEWNSRNYVSLEETALPLPLGQAGTAYNSSTAWDYFHINSITKGNDGHYLLSARHASTLYKINGTNGSLIWRFGGKYSDFQLGPEVAFGFQHHARYISGGNETHELISFLDNSVYGSESAGGGDKEVHLYSYSRGKYVMLDHITKQATLLKAFLPPREPILSKSQGSLQVLPQGNALINWGSEGQVTEYQSDGEPVFHAFLDSGFLQDKLQNYRAFRYKWTGISPESLALFAEEVEDERIHVYVSWNGDTRTRTWRFKWTVDAAQGQVGGEPVVQRTGFETSARQPAKASEGGSISVAALDDDGEVLATSEEVTAVSAYWLDTSTKDRDIYDDQQIVLAEL